MLPIQLVNSMGVNITGVVTVMRVKMCLTASVNISRRKAKNKLFQSSMESCRPTLIKGLDEFERLGIKL